MTHQNKLIKIQINNIRKLLTLILNKNIKIKASNKTIVKLPNLSKIKTEYTKNNKKLINSEK